MTDLTPSSELDKNSMINALNNCNLFSLFNGIISSSKLAVSSAVDTAISSGRMLITTVFDATISTINVNLAALAAMITANKGLNVLPYRENPYSNNYGQEQISQVETFWRRLSREGSVKSSVINGNTVTPSSSYLTIANMIVPDSGNTLYPKGITLSFDFTNSNLNTGDVLIYIYTTSSTYYTIGASLTNGRPLVIPFDGEHAIGTGGHLDIKHRALPSLLNNLTQTVTTTSGSPILTSMVYATSSMKNMTITGTGIPSNTKIIDILSNTSVLLSANCTASASVTATLTDTPAAIFGSAWGVQRNY